VQRRDDPADSCSMPSAPGLANNQDAVQELEPLPRLEHAELDCAVRVFAPGKIDRPINSEANRVTAALTPEVYRKITQSFFPCQLKIDLPPGEYLLRMAVRDNLTGLLGSVNAQVKLPAMAAEAEKPVEKK